MARCIRSFGFSTATVLLVWLVAAAPHARGEIGTFDIVAVNGRAMAPTHAITVRPGDTFTLHWDIPAAEFAKFPHQVGAIFVSAPQYRPPFTMPNGGFYLQADLTQFGGNPSAGRPAGTWEWKTAPVASDSYSGSGSPGWLRTSHGNGHADPRACMAINPGVWHLWMGGDFFPGETSGPLTAIITVDVKPEWLDPSTPAVSAGSPQRVDLSWRLDYSGPPSSGDHVDVAAVSDRTVVCSAVNPGDWTAATRLPLELPALPPGAYSVTYYRGPGQGTPLTAMSRRGPLLLAAVAAGDVVLAPGDDFQDSIALDDLASFLTRLTGQPGPTFRNASPEAPPAVIHVGRSAFVDAAVPQLDTLDLEAFVIRTVRRAGMDHLILAGRTPRGTAYAVNRYLMTYCDVRWLMPGDLGLEMPHLDGVPVPTRAALRETPTLQHRSYSGPSAPGFDARWFLGRRWDGAFHNLSAIVPAGIYGETHPEYYSMINGSRVVGLQACTTNPEVIRLAEEAARAFFAAEPDMMSFSLSSNDGSGYCECATCKALDPPGAAPFAVTDRYYTFVNEVAADVAKTYPGKYIAAHAYSNNADPPVRLKIRDNVLPFITLGFATGSARPHAVIDHLKDWRRHVAHFGIYQYIYGQFPYAGMFNHYPHALADLQRQANRLGCVASFAETLPIWAMDAPKLYCYAMVMWNDKADVDELMDDWVRHAYGPAAAPMRRFWDRWERAYEARGKAHRYEGSLRWWPRYLDEFSMVTAEELAGMGADLEAAKALAMTDRQKGRIALVDKAFRFARFYVQAALDTARLEAIGEGAASAGHAEIIDTAARMRRGQQERAEYFAGLAKEQDPLLWPGGQPSTQDIHVWHHEHSMVARENAAIATALRAMLLSGRTAEPAAGSDPGLAKLLAAARLLAAPQEMAAGNLLRNAGFEEASAADPLQSGEWSVYHNYGPGATLRCDERLARSGRRSLSLRNGQLTGDGYAQTVPIQGGEWYLLSGWVQGKLADPSNETFYLVLRWEGQRDAAAAIALQGPPGDAWIGLPQKNFRKWTQLVGIVHVPAHANSASVLVEAESGPQEGALRVDDVSLVRIP
jgi:hypothetical protein